MKSLVTFFLVFSAFGFILNAQQFSDTLWSNSYGGTNDEAAGFGNASFGSPSVSAVTDGDDIYLLSYSSSEDLYVPSKNDSEDVYLLKLNADTGDTIWTKSYGGTDTERAYDLIVHSDNHIYISGRSSSDDDIFTGNNGGSDGFILKIDKNGDVVWINLFGGTQPESFYSLVEAPNGNIVAVGETGSSDGDLNGVPVGTGLAWIIEIDSDNGDIVWQTVSSGIQEPTNPDHIENFWNVILLNDESGYVTVGSDGHFNDFNSDDIMVMKFDLSGEKVWEKGFGGPQRDWAAGVVEYDNHLFVAGNAGGQGGDVSNFYGLNDFWLLKLDMDGELIEEKVFGGTDIDYPYGIELDESNNNLILTGITRSDDNDLDGSISYGGIDAWAFALNPADLEIESNYRWGGSDSDFAHQVVFNSNSSFPIVVGRTNSDDSYFAKEFNSTVLFATAFGENNANTQNFSSLSREVSIYPNPAEEIISIKVGESFERFDIIIHDTQGRRIFKESNKHEKETSLNISEYQSGIYIISVTTEIGVASKKFIKR